MSKSVHSIRNRGSWRGKSSRSTDIMITGKVISSLLSLLRKIKIRFMWSPCCLCACTSVCLWIPPINFRMPEPICMKLGTYRFLCGTCRIKEKQAIRSSQKFSLAYFLYFEKLIVGVYELFFVNSHLKNRRFIKVTTTYPLEDIFDVLIL
jgi:hypothetical protein